MTDRPTDGISIDDLHGLNLVHGMYVTVEIRKDG